MKEILEQIDKWLREATANQSKYAFTCPKAFHRGEVSAYNKVRVLLQRHLTSRRSRAANACALWDTCDLILGLDICVPGCAKRTPPA